MELASYLPPRLLEEYQPLALLQDRGWRQTLLLRHRRTGLQVICKRASDAQSHLQDEHLLLRQLAGPAAGGQPPVLRPPLPLTAGLFCLAANRYWVLYGRRYGVSAEQMRTPDIEA